MDFNGSVAFQVNDYILHGGSGVCKILDICNPNTNRIDPSKTYYRLMPLYEKGSVIYTPIDNAKSILRKILTRDQALRLIDQINGLDVLWIENEKTREETYRNALRTHDCTQWMRVIKTLYLRNQNRVQDGKKISQTDEKYLRIAEDLMYGELSISLEAPKDRIAEMVASHILDPQGELCS